MDAYYNMSVLRAYGRALLWHGQKPGVDVSFDYFSLFYYSLSLGL
jgi:hypothetical protein